MKRLLTTLCIIICLLPYAALAQDARHRTTNTIIADGLAQLPADNAEKYNTVMGELAATGEEGIKMLGEMLVPATEGPNAIVEYALNGVVDYVSKADETLREGVRKGIIAALETCSDNPNKAFLLTLLQMCPAEENLSIFLQYLSDPYLADWAANGLIFLPNADEQILDLMQSDGAPRATLAYAAEQQRLTQAEPILLQWLNGADVETTTAIHKALARCGTTASLSTLKSDARAVDYGDDPTVATDSYIIHLRTLAANGDEMPAYGEADNLLRATDRSNVRCAALEIICAAIGKKAKKYVLEAMKDGDRDYRVTALRCAEAFANDGMYSSLGKLLSDKEEENEAKEDIINWFGTNHIASQIDAIIPCMHSSDDSLALSAIAAAGEIGGDKALDALIEQLSGSHYAAATAALLAFNGDINSAIVGALDNDKIPQERVLNIISLRHILPADEIVALIQKQNDIQTYYPVLAQVGNTAAIDEIMKGYNSAAHKAEAFDALLKIDNTEMIDVLYNIAVNDKEDACAALVRYNQLVSAADYTPEQKFELYEKALKATDDPAAENAIITSLASVGTPQALLLAEQYLENPATALTSAYAIHSIVVENTDSFDRETAITALEKARDYLAGVDDADASYTVEDINNLLSKLSAVGESPSNSPATLSDEEAKEGFELLFDGLTMNGWTGNTIDYVPLDGTIYVSAEYGGTGNLYTIKEYSDFIFRFEFCYVKEGINNGVGIRTPMGVDAAYEGMEIQILDHDAPIYKDLHEYQQHGSVYGIIPAKRVKFPPLGTWNTEEIKAVGNHITVTVNGEVILDGDIYEACQGHNVSEDGSDVNPYTVDHLNHPGLFNKSGHIGFLGHGEGLQLRNIRIKDLSK